MADQVGIPDGWEVVDTPQTASNSPQAMPSTLKALALQMAAKAVPVASTVAVEAATNPNVPRYMSTAGQLVGGIEGALKGGPLGAAGGAWAGGRAGWFTGKLAQKLGAPVASAMDAAKPYAQSLSTLAGAQGVNDLAQMAEPGRQDIGFMGIGHKTDNTPTPEALKQLPALVRTVQTAVAKGQSPSQAIQLITGGNPQLMGPLMMAYMKAQQVK